MRRLTATLLALIFTASACFGTTGSWRCLNGAPCVFTPGVGFHCPGLKPASKATSGVARPEGQSCPHCRQPTANVKTDASSGPCGALCRGCRCEFRVISSHVPGTLAATVHGTPTFAFADHPVVFAAPSMPTVGFGARPIVFTTGPPQPLCTNPCLTTPARAPPRLLTA